MPPRCLIVLCLTVIACTKPASERAPSASASPATSAPVPTIPPVPPALAQVAPADLDVDGLKKTLACASGRKRSTCRILNDFGNAARFAPQIPSGEGRWIGNAFALEKQAPKSDLLLLSVSRVPTSTVPAGELSLRIGTGALPADKRDHGVKLANALARGDTVSRNNAAAPYVKGWKALDAQGTMNTSGSSIRLVAQETFLRQGSGDKVLLVRLKRTKSGALEGTVAELWPASW
jgi:hypothetical protein